MSYERYCSKVAPRRQKEAINSLTGLRFFAAGMIVWLHVRVLPGVENAPYLALGVSLFFVLSGFILAHNYRSITRDTVARFLVARASKIYPLHLFSLALVIVLLPNPIFPPQDVVDVGRLVANILLLQSWYPHVQNTLAFNGVSWTLSNELFFYLCFPIIYLGFRGHFAKLLGVWLVLFAISTLVVTWLQPPLPWGLQWKHLYQFLPVYRLGEFLAGIVAYEMLYRPLAHKRCNWALVSLLQILSVVFALHIESYAVARAQPLMNTPYDPLAHWLQLTGGILPSVALVVVLSFRGAVADLLGAQPFRLLGEISFATYMLHAIVLKLFRNLGLEEVFNIGSLLLLYLFVTYSLSYFAWRFIEVPSQAFLRTWHAKGLPAALPRATQAIGLQGRKEWIALLAAAGLCVAIAHGVVKETSFPFSQPIHRKFENGMEMTVSPPRTCFSGICISVVWRGHPACGTKLRRVIHIVGNNGRVIEVLHHDLTTRMCVNGIHQRQGVYVDEIHIQGNRLLSASALRLGLTEPQGRRLVPFAHGTTGAWMSLWKRGKVR